MRTPAVTILMPVFNAAKYLPEAVDSILNQTLTNFEFLIINDGSTDKSLEILKSYATKDKRINLISRENRGLVVTLNEGMQLAQGDYIARMDADDISDETRLEKQLEFLEKNTRYVAVSCLGNVINEDSKQTSQIDLPLSWSAISIVLCFNNAFIHSGMMIRSRALGRLRYDPAKWPAEDYDLWVRLAERGKLKNLSQRLLSYRKIKSGISQKNTKKQESISKEIADDYARKLSVGRLIVILPQIVGHALQNRRLKSAEASKTLSFYEASGLINLYKQSGGLKKVSAYLSFWLSALANQPYWRIYLHLWRTDRR